MRTIDINSDVGEGFGIEAELLPLISSCNISCGVHAGDDTTIAQVIDLALEYDLAIGAHPSFNDRENFGRKRMYLDSLELNELVIEQVRKLKRMVENKGGRLNHVKPHGALYNMAAESSAISRAIISAIQDVDKNLKLYGLANSQMELESQSKIEFVAEGFADRKYKNEAALIERRDGGLISTAEEVKNHLKNILFENRVDTLNGPEKVNIQSICVHGDTPAAVDVIRTIRNFLIKEGIEIRAIL